MKKLFALITAVGLLFGTAHFVFAEDVLEGAEQTEVVDTVTAEATEDVAEEAPVEAAIVEEVVEEVPVHQQIKKTFIDGGPAFMGAVLLCLIFGVALAIERIIYLNLATTNTTKLLASVEDALNNGGVEAAKEVCRNTPGPVASIFYQGLERFDEGVEMVEKSVISYGSVQMGMLEKNMSWISLFIAIAPMLGFMGTVLGMISAFNQIELAGNVSASLVAGGIKIALITTVSGLIVAIILQILYNYIVSKIDSIVNSMEDASISLIDILVKYNLKK